MAESAGRTKSATALRRRWLAAGAASLAVHGFVILGLALTTPKEGPAREPPVFEVTLERLSPPPEIPKPSARTPVQPPASTLRVHQPPAIVPGASTSGLPASPGGPATSGPSGPTASAAPTPANPKLKLDCLHMGPRARTGVYGQEDCEVQRYAKVPGSDQVFTTPSNPAWDAQIAGRMRKHEPLQTPQPNRTDCPGANLGIGCVDDALILSTKKKF